MIDDMAALKQAMEQMDAEDPDEAQAAKERAAQTLSDAKLSFSKIAELIEQHRLLLRPRIVSGIKRMDQPGMLGDAAFRDASSALRREGQSFRQIAEAIEFSTGAAPRYADPAPAIDPPHEMPSEPLHEMTNAAEYQMMGPPVHDMPEERRRVSLWMRALLRIGAFFLFPVRHPVRVLVIAFIAYLLSYVVGVVSPQGAAAMRQAADRAMSSVSSLVNEQILGRPSDTAAVPAAPRPTPSPATSPSSSLTSVTPSATPAPSAAPPLAPPVINPAPSANPSAPPSSPRAASPPAAPQPTAPASPPASPPRREARGAPPSRPAVNCDLYPSSRFCAQYEENRSHALDDVIPEQVRRRSRMGGPCVGGIGGCYWGGMHY